MRRTGLGLMVLLVAGLLVLPALSQSKPPQPAQGGSVSGESAGTQARLQREFQEFKLALKLLEQRLEKSGKPDDKLRVASIREALKLIEEKSTDSKFENILQDLRKQELFKSTDKLQGLVDRNKDLAEDLARLIDALNRDPEAELRRQREEAKKVLEKLKDVIGKQERVRGNTEQGRMSKEELEKAQAKVTQETRELKNLIEGKKSSSKDGDPKDGKSKDGMGKDGDPKDGKGKDGKDGMGKDGQSQDGMNKDSGGDESADSSQQPLPQEKDQARKRIQEATEFQKESEKKIAKDEKKAASEKQGDALDKLKEAQKKLEELLKQLREEEIDRVLVQLQARCVEMLRLQMEVRAGTAELQASVMARPDKKPDRVHEQKALEWHDREAQIVRKAADALRLIESEGSAVAFAEVFRQVGDDMSNVRDRLKLADVGEETVRIEDDIIATLREMIESLKKAQQDNKNKKPPMPGQPGQQNPGQQDQRLIDQISELKMIRSMQLQINKRTESYGRKFEGEQAPDPSAVPDARSKAQAEQVLKEIRDLGRRQDKIGKVARDISLGRNKGQ